MKLSLSNLSGVVNRELGPTKWVPITQDRIAEFAEATGDDQSIHVDIERARTENPFGTTIAHGYLALSVINQLLPELLTVEDASMGVNVGLDRVRFPAPMAAESAIRARGKVVSVEPVGGGTQVVVRVMVEIEGSDELACVADTVSRFFGPNP